MFGILWLSADIVWPTWHSVTLHDLYGVAVVAKLTYLLLVIIIINDQHQMLLTQRTLHAITFEPTPASEALHSSSVGVENKSRMTDREWTMCTVVGKFMAARELYEGSRPSYIRRSLIELAVYFVYICCVTYGTLNCSHFPWTDWTILSTRWQLSTTQH